MDEIKITLRKRGFKGEVDDSIETRDVYSHDASMFEIRPQLVVMPKDAEDVATIVRLVSEQKASQSDLSVTARSAGTDMSGAAINDSIIIDFSKYFTDIEHVSATAAQVQPGVLYRNFEKITLQHHALLPPYPASRDLCSLGGMVNNNSGGEKSLEFGKTENFVTELKMVFADGVERIIR